MPSLIAKNGCNVTSCGGLSLYWEVLLVFVHVGEIETFHGEAQAEFEAANVVALRNECVAVAVEVDELVKQL